MNSYQVGVTYWVAAETKEEAIEYVQQEVYGSNYSSIDVIDIEDAINDGFDNDDAPRGYNSGIKYRTC